MSKPANLKIQPARGRVPTLQFCLTRELQIDASYQRSLDNPASQALIRRIAQNWNWDLCQPLTVSNRGEAGLFVIDGQHRHAAALMRGDIDQLPCVVALYPFTAAEAATFVNLNQQRRPLSRLELFKGEVASGNVQARALVEIIESCGLSLANSTNNVNRRPGQIDNIAGLVACQKMHGDRVLRASLTALVQAWPGQVLRYAGTIFPGIAAVVADEIKGSKPGTWESSEMPALLAAMLGAVEQGEWIADLRQFKASEAGQSLNWKQASIATIQVAWSETLGALLEDAA